MTRAQSYCGIARLSESGIARQWIPTVSFVQDIFSSGKGRRHPRPRGDWGRTGRPRGDHRVRLRTIRIREYPCRPAGIFCRVRAGVINEIAHAVFDSVDQRAARDESASVSVDDGRSRREGTRGVGGSVGRVRDIRLEPIEEVAPVADAR